VTPGKKFCRSCGAALTTEPAGRFASPEAYTPKHLAEKILTSKTALEGERKQVTVLFADLKGSMGLLADRDPEEARQILDPVLERMMEAVHRYEGTVNQVMGDGIMALFGAPLAHEDHAVRACYAALRMHQSVGRYAEELRRSQGLDVQIRVGLNSGEVVVRTIGSDLHMDYTAVGQTTHLAARMEQLARPGTTLITADTLRLAEGYIEVNPLGPVPIRGLSGPIETYEITGAGPVRTRFQAIARRGLTRFIGRNAELEQLRRAQQLASAGHGQVAAIVGEAGVGKSRLAYEFTHSHRLQDWLTLESASVSYGKATSYLPVIELLKGYFKIQDRDHLREIREKVTGKLLILDESLKPTLPALLALLDVPVDDEAWDRLDPIQRRQRTLDAVKALLLREAREQPLLVIFEDLHWIDGETQALLDSVVESLASARLLLLVNYRPEYEHRWSSKTYYSQMRLDALPAESAEQLLEVLLGEDRGLAPLKQLLVKRGNPFFLEETVRTLVETKTLVGEQGRYRLTQSVQALQVPATVQAVLAARIDRLPPEEKRLLQVASVVGKDVPVALLQAIAELPEADLQRSLTHLQAAEFLYEMRFFPELEYTFKHALTHEVTYGTLLRERRCALHARLVPTIEHLYTERLVEQVGRLAHHAWHGEVWDKAALYGRQAGAKAVSRSAYRDAVTCFEQALIALGRLPKSQDTIEQDIDLRCELRDVLFPLGDYKKCFEHLSTAEPLASSLNDRPRLARVLSHLSMSFLTSGEHVRALQVGERALLLATAHGDAALEPEARWRVAFAHHMLGSYSNAIDLRQKVVVSVAHDPLRFLGAGLLFSVLSRWGLVSSLIERGQFAEAIALAKEASQLAERSAPPTQGVACLGLGLVHLHEGDLQKAIPPLQRGVQVSHASQVLLWLPLTISCLGSAYVLSGRTAEGLPLLEQAVEQPHPTWQSTVMINLGQGYLLARRVEDAMRLAESALDLTRKRKERGLEARALWLLGEIAAHPDNREVEKADVHYGEATGLATELEMRPLVAHCHLGLGKLYLRMGNREQAQEHLTTATTMYREMGMTYWLEKAKAEMTELG
jgi:class 3 adenylate cyclase/tetratricopeptide (TPR) repeat protein